MKRLKLIVYFFVLALLVAACGGAPAAGSAPVSTVVADNVVIAEGRLEPIHFTQLALNAGGLVSEVFVVEGDQVAAGDVIARLEAPNAQTLISAQAAAARELTAAHQDMRDTQFKLDNFDAPSDFWDLTPNEALKVSLEKLTKARKDFEPYKHLSVRVTKLTEAEKNTEIFKTDAKRYKKYLDDAWAKYRKALEWLDIETNFVKAQARLAQAQKNYDALFDPSLAENTAGVRAALANAEVRAPFNGTVTNLNLKVGEFAATGQIVVTIADTSSWVVKTKDLTELDVVHIKEGQTAIVKFDAMPEMEFSGNVTSVGKNFTESQGDVVYETTILLAKKNPAMRWGMTAQVEFR
jgi:multidrug resistance efflux pump